MLAREGARVLCVDRDLARAEDTVGEIAGAGGQASSFQADIVAPGQAASILATAEDRMGLIDILINNVCIGGGGDGSPTTPARRRSTASGR